jgi:methyl-accepting chemotaxis protein
VPETNNQPNIKFNSIFQRNFLMTVTQRLLLTFSLLSASLVALVIVMGIVLSGFQSRFQYVQEKSVPSIVALDELIANREGANKFLI